MAMDTLPTTETQAQMSEWLTGTLQEAQKGYWRLERYLLTPPVCQFRPFNEQQDNLLFPMKESNLTIQTKSNPFLNPPQPKELEPHNLSVLVTSDPTQKDVKKRRNEKLYCRRRGLPDPFLKGDEAQKAKEWEQLLPHFGFGAEARVYYVFPKGQIDEKKGEVTPSYVCRVVKTEKGGISGKETSLYVKQLSDDLLKAIEDDPFLTDDCARPVKIFEVLDDGRVSIMNHVNGISLADLEERLANLQPYCSSGSDRHLRETQLSIAIGASRQLLSLMELVKTKRAASEHLLSQLPLGMIENWERIDGRLSLWGYGEGVINGQLVYPLTALRDIRSTSIFLSPTGTDIKTEILDMSLNAMSLPLGDQRFKYAPEGRELGLIKARYLSEDLNVVAMGILRILLPKNGLFEGESAVFVPSKKQQLDQATIEENLSEIGRQLTERYGEKLDALMTIIRKAFLGTYLTREKIELGNEEAQARFLKETEFDPTNVKKEIGLTLIKTLELQ